MRWIEPSCKIAGPNPKVSVTWFIFSATSQLKATTPQHNYAVTAQGIKTHEAIWNPKMKLYYCI